jgi:hypothetical protein
MEAHITLFPPAPSKPDRQWKRLDVRGMGALVFLQTMAPKLPVYPHDTEHSQPYEAFNALNADWSTLPRPYLFFNMLTITQPAMELPIL